MEFGFVAVFRTKSASMIVCLLATNGKPGLHPKDAAPVTLFEDTPFTFLSGTFSLDDILYLQPFDCTLNSCSRKTQHINHFSYGYRRIDLHCIKN